MPTQTLFPLMLIRRAGLPLDRLAALSADWKTLQTEFQVGQIRLEAAAQALRAAFDTALSALPASPLRTAVYNARKRFYQQGKLPAKDHFFEKNNPHPALETLDHSLNNYRNAEAAQQAQREVFEQAYRQNLHLGYACLQEIAATESFQRALLFASHSLLDQLPDWTQRAPQDFSKRDRQTAAAVLQYATRMAVKTSPFSRFTTVSVQAVGEAPGPLGSYAVAPNVAILEALYPVLLSEPAFYRSLSVALNPSLEHPPAENRYRWLHFDGQNEALQELTADPLLDFLAGQLAAEPGRKINFKLLLDRLAPAVDAGRDALENWLLELLDLGFLDWQLPEQGLSPYWAGNLQRYLGFLPAQPAIVEAASLLQWLRGAARTLPYQPVEQALETLAATRRALEACFERRGAPAPAIPLEQLFYEDAVQPCALPIGPAELEKLAQQLTDCWRQRPGKPLPEGRARAMAAAGAALQTRNNRPFLELFREIRSVHAPADDQAQTAGITGPQPQKIGALIQPFEENGQWYAVVNGLYPGGGKLFARWLHAFPGDFTAQFQDWFSSNKPGWRIVQFPGQSWFNANFQPALSFDALLAPGGRTAAFPGGQEHLLSALVVCRDKDRIVLMDRESGHFLELNDLGLEAPEQRPPAMQLLAQLGTAYVSLDALRPPADWVDLAGSGVLHRARQCFENLVLARAAWSFPPDIWERWKPEAGATPAENFRRLRALLAQWQVPRYFFARFEAEKPQYFDQDSPLLLQFFEKLLRQGQGALLLTEMLPLPAHWNSAGQGQRVLEIVLEFQV